MAPQLYTAAQVAKAGVLWVLLFLSLPLSPLYLVATLVYQAGCVHGKLSPTSRVATFVTCIFLAVAWIPFVTVYYYIDSPRGTIECRTRHTDDDGHVHYNVSDRDYQTVYRNDQGVQLDTIMPIVTLALWYLWGSVTAWRVYSIDDSYEEEKDRAEVGRLRANVVHPPIRFKSRRTGDILDLSTAYEMYMALKNESPENATVVAVGVGTLLATVLTTVARAVQALTAESTDDLTCAYPGQHVFVPGEHLNQTGSNGTSMRLYLEGPTFALSTVYYWGMFLVFFSTFAFVATLYINHVRVVWQLTFFAGGDSGRSAAASRAGADRNARVSLAATLAMLQRGVGDDDDEPETLVEPDSPDSPMTRPRPSRDADGPSPAPSGMFLEDDRNHQFNHRLAVGASMNFAAASAVPHGSDFDVRKPGGGPSCNAMQPYNILHLRAWDEVRQVAATYIAAPRSTLNAFLTPTLWFAVIALGGSYMYLIVSFFISFKNIGPFASTMLIIFVVFILFFMVMIQIAKTARKHFKFHNVIVARIAFDVACEIDARTPLVQQGIESIAERRPGMEHMDLPTLVEMHESALGLLSFMEATSPMPLLLGVEHRHVKYGVAYFLLVSANVLFIALLSASNSGKCFDDD